MDPKSKHWSSLALYSYHTHSLKIISDKTSVFLCVEVVLWWGIFFVVSCQHSRSYGILSILNFGLSWLNLYWNWAVGIAQRQSMCLLCVKQPSAKTMTKETHVFIPATNTPPYTHRKREHAREYIMLLSSVFLLLLDTVKSLRNTVYVFLSMWSMGRHLVSSGNLPFVLSAPT